VSRARPVLAAVPADEEARWRSALAARIRPEFRVDRYLPPREHLVLYGPHCSVAGCDRPGNERLVGPARLCERHARIWARVRGMSIEAWLAEAPEIRRRSDATGMPHYDLTSESPVRRDELRFLLQSLHDGRFTLTFTTKRWNALRAVYRDRESLLGWDLAQHPAPAVVATGSAKRFQLFLLGVRRELLGREPSWRDEVWPREFYAPFDRGLRSKLPAAMDFTCVRAPWLRQLAQRVCWTRLSVEAVAPNVAWQMVRHVAQFERWAEDRVAGPESLTRELLLDYLAHVRASDLSAKTKAAQLIALRTFLNRARIAGAPIASSATYLPGEIEPQREAGIRARFLDAREVAQVDDPRNLARLSDFDRRLYVVLRRTGMRVSSAVTLAIDCVIESGGAYYLRFWNTKARGGPREATIPIGGDLAAAVREQQHHVRGRYGATATYLFPARNGAPAGDRPANPAAVGRTLARWARACGMTASDGSPLALTPHRLRHTLATEMLNQGVSQRAIQDHLDHSSPEMTAVYAKLLDSTLRAEFDAYQQRVNIRGERIAVLPADVPDDAVLLKERIARAKQTLPNGYCGLPLQLECPHPNACLSCDAFLTDDRFRPVLEQQLERTRELIGRATEAGHERVIEINSRDETSLVAILVGLDAIEHKHTGDGFDLRDRVDATDTQAAS